MVEKEKSLWITLVIVMTCSVSVSLAVECEYVLRFDGVDDVAVIPHDESLSLNEFSLEVWAKIDTLDMSRNVFIQKNSQHGNFGNYSLGVLGSETLAIPGRLEYVHQTASGNWSCGPSSLMMPGVWTHIAVTFSGGFLKWYINGSQEGTFFTETQPIQSISDLLFGSGYGNTNHLQGELDDVRIWNVELTSGDIGGDVLPDTPGLVGYWKFNEALNDQHIYDASPFANHGTLGVSLAIANDDPIRVGPPCGRIIYVDDDATGANDGTSWINAYTYLQDALEQAKETAESVEICVAQGIYKPDRGASETPSDRNATFQLVNGVTLMGGYAGIGAEDPNCRNPEEYETILSGDLQENDDVSEGSLALVDDPSRADNSNHVVTGSGTDATAVLDGFIIEGGRSDDNGGGMFNYEGSPTIRYCTFRLNGAYYSGGGMYNWNSSVSVYRSEFSKNYAAQGGGVRNGSPNSNPPVMIICCAFQDNKGEFGGAVLNSGNCDAKIEYCSFLRNSAGNGGGIRTINQSSTVEVTGCTFSSNSARLNGGALQSVTTPQGLVIVRDCSFSNNQISGSGGSGGAVCMEGDGTSRLLSCRHEGNLANEYGGGAYYTAGTEHTLINCQFVGNAANEGGGLAIRDSNVTLQNCTIVRNSSTSNLESSSHGIWSDSHNLTIANSIVWDADGMAIVLPEPPIFPLAIDYSCVPEAYSGYGQGNISTDPWTNLRGTLLFGSPCIDAGNDALVPADYYDIDGDGQRNEPLPWDLLSNSRFVDDPATVNTGLGIVDMGAFEYTPSASPSSDLGDAPDSSNSFPGTAMTAYPKNGPPDVRANYPSVYKPGSPPYGPIHWNPEEVAFLGKGVTQENEEEVIFLEKAVTLENEADIGPDADPTNNLSPLCDCPDRDERDDGIILPLALPHCGEATFDYIVSLVSEPPGPLYVNVWCDWNRDGDWDDTLECPDGTTIPEWAVQNQEPILASIGENIVTTPPFLCWHPENACHASCMWLRITLSERPWQALGSGLGSGGAGDVDGYNYGETEDHYIRLEDEPAEDWGDAPGDTCLPGYPTLLIHDGARHLIGGPWFGADPNGPDSEPDGQPNSNASGDDQTDGNDDEDGIPESIILTQGWPGRINIIVSGGGGYVRAWIDWDRDWTWEPQELIFGAGPLNSFLPNGINILTFDVPDGAHIGTTFARFRISSEYGLEPTGPAGDGEVEDYPVIIKEITLFTAGQVTCETCFTCPPCSTGTVVCSVGYGSDSNYLTMDRPALGSPVIGSGPTTTPECLVVHSLQKDWLITNWTCPAINVDCPATVPAGVSTSDEESQEEQAKVSKVDGDNEIQADS